MALYGSAELCLDRKHTFCVTTCQATILLKIAEKHCSLESLSQFCQIDESMIGYMLDPMISCGLVTKSQAGFEIGTEPKLMGNPKTPYLSID